MEAIHIIGSFCSIAAFIMTLVIGVKIYNIKITNSKKNISKVKQKKNKGKVITGNINVNRKSND